MTEALAAAASSLDWHAEEEWGRLKMQFELDKGFWLGFAFAPSLASADALRKRADALLRSHSSSLAHVAPKSPAELRDLASRLVKEDFGDAACIWIDAVQDTEEWTAARETMLVRLNEHREAMIRRQDRGVLFFFARDAKPRVREVAPDLWAIRSIVLHLNPVALTDGIPGDLALRAFTVHPEEPIPAEAELALSEANRLAAQNKVAAAAQNYIRAAEAFMRAGAVEQARRAAHAAVTTAAGDAALLAPALSTLAAVESADGDHGAAMDHINRAIELAENEGHPVPGRWYVTSADVLLDQGRYAEALSSFGKAFDRFEDTGAAEDAAKALANLGWVTWQMNGARAAVNLFEQAAARLRPIFQAEPSPGIGKALLYTLTSASNALLNSGDAEAAARWASEALSILANHSVDDAASSNVLARVYLGRAAQQTGDLESARTHLREALDLVGQIADPAQRALRAATTNSVLASIERRSGSPKAALRHYTSAVSAVRELIERRRETPHNVRRLMLALTRQAEFQSLQDADDTLAEVVTLARRLIQTLGSSDMSMSALFDALGSRARVLGQLKKFREAREHIEQAILLVRELEKLDANFDAALADTLLESARIESELGDARAGMQRLQEAASVLRSRAVSPDAVRSLIGAFEELAQSMPDHANEIRDEIAAVRAAYHLTDE